MRNSGIERFWNKSAIGNRFEQFRSAIPEYLSADQESRKLETRFVDLAEIENTSTTNFRVGDHPSVLSLLSFGLTQPSTLWPGQWMQHVARE
jgi:hypothetical protein